MFNVLSVFVFTCFSALRSWCKALYKYGIIIIIIIIISWNKMSKQIYYWPKYLCQNTDFRVPFSHFSEIMGKGLPISLSHIDYEWMGVHVQL